MRSQHGGNRELRLLARMSWSMRLVDGDTKSPVAEAFSSARRAAPSLGSHAELYSSVHGRPEPVDRGGASACPHGPFGEGLARAWAGPLTLLLHSAHREHGVTDLEFCTILIKSGSIENQLWVRRHGTYRWDLQ